MSDIAQKWGGDVAQRGFAQIPNYLLLLNQFLDEERRLSPTELLVLLQLVGSWWVKDALPFPSMKTLAVRCGVSDRQIQRAVNKLEKIKVIKRVSRRKKGIIASNAYDLAPLVTLLGDVAKAFPNEFPRNVDKATVAALSARLSTPTAPIEVEDEMPESSEVGEIIFSVHPNWDQRTKCLKILATASKGFLHIQCLIAGLVFTDHFGAADPHHLDNVATFGQLYLEHRLGFEQAFRRMIEAHSFSYEGLSRNSATRRVMLTTDNFVQWFPEAELIGL